MFAWMVSTGLGKTSLFTPSVAYDASLSSDQ